MISHDKCCSKGHILSLLTYWETLNLWTCSWPLRLGSKQFSFLKSLGHAGSAAYPAQWSPRRGQNGHGSGNVIPGNRSRHGLGSGCLAICVCLSFQTAESSQWTACQGISEPFCRALENWLDWGWGGGRQGKTGMLWFSKSGT